MRFTLNGYLWTVVNVNPFAEFLRDRSGHITVATTDPNTHCVYIATNLMEPFRHHVLLHELGHCTMISYGLLDDIHRMVRPEYWVEAEEWVCNFLANYGQKIFEIVAKLTDSNTALKTASYVLDHIR